LGTLGSSQFRQEAVLLGVGLKHRLQALVLLSSRRLLGDSIGLLAFLLVQTKLREAIGSLISSLILEAQVLDQILAWVGGDQSLHHLPVCLFFFTGGICGPSLTECLEVTLLQSVLEGFRGISNALINLERRNLDLGHTRVLLIKAKRNYPATKAKGGTAWPFEPARSLGKSEFGDLRLCLGLVEEVFAVQGLVVVGNSLSIVGLRVLQGLDRDPSIERGGSKEVRVVRVPASLEGPVRDNGELSVGLTGLWVPADVAVILTGRKKKAWVMVTP
jgi:hypothetical protein